jgi:chemotaxis protein methyltransferase CheR
MNKTIFSDLKDLIYQKLGLHFSDEKDYLLESKINRLLQREKYQSLEEFYQAIKGGDRESLETLIKYITTNHTFFFREKEHLETLVRLIKQNQTANPVIWSSACSTGEEVYSIIITLLENQITKFLVIASDINSNVLHQTKEGVYHINRFNETPELIIKKYFKKIDEENFQILPELKEYMTIKKLNLIERNQFVSKLDFIFCRNVLIYFDQETRNLVIRNLLANLKPKGYFFVGHTETLINSTFDIERESNSVYRYLGGSNG